MKIDFINMPVNDKATVTFESEKGIYCSALLTKRSNDMILCNLQFDWEDYGSGNRLGHASLKDQITISISGCGNAKEIAKKVTKEMAVKVPYGIDESIIMYKLYDVSSFSDEYIKELKTFFGDFERKNQKVIIYHNKLRWEDFTDWGELTIEDGKFIYINYFIPDRSAPVHEKQEYDGEAKAIYEWLPGFNVPGVRELRHFFYERSNGRPVTAPARPTAVKNDEPATKVSEVSKVKEKTNVKPEEVKPEAVKTEAVRPARQNVTVSPKGRRNFYIGLAIVFGIAILITLLPIVLF